MNTSHLKKFAQEARRKLLEQVGAKLNFVLTTDSAELREKTEQLKQLRQELSRTTKEQLIERVAYTWFNRLMALRFLDANDYQPLGIRIITPKDSYTIPELLDEAKRGNIPVELKVNRQKIYDILDNRIPSKNPQNEAFKELLIAACNNMHTTFPFLFERINDYTELLLPDDLTSDFSIVKNVREGMPTEDCQNVEIIGWLYQFYISEKKDAVFASKSKVKKEDIPAATQLFTPRWIVEYMVQNTLGKLWLQNRPKSNLREYMQYFIESASLEAEDYLKINSPEEIKFLDPASGSGHILVYAFDLLTRIYEEEGYNTNEIPQLIIENNLYGFEIDERAAQLSALSLLMKAQEYHRKVYRKGINPNILCSQDLLVSKDEIKEIFTLQKIQISNELMHDLLLMQQSTNFGSLIIPHAEIAELKRISEILNQSLPNADVFQRTNVESIIESIGHLQLLAQKFHCVVANPPYMGNGNMNATVSEFLKNSYPDSKADLMACFMESGLEMLQECGFLGMINQHSWLFIGSYEKLRKKLIKNIFIDTLLHLGARTFPEISGEVVQNASFTLWKKRISLSGIYFKLFDYNNTKEKCENFISANNNGNNIRFKKNQIDFIKISGSPISYWAENFLIKIFDKEKILKNYASPSKGMMTGNGSRFLRNFWEIDYRNFALGINTHESSLIDSRRWYPYYKGGTYRKWYGNKEFVVNFKNDGKELKENNYGERSPSFYFKNCLNWSKISGKFSMRIGEIGGLYDDAACQCPVKNDNDLYYILGYLNSSLSNLLLNCLSNTMNISPGEVAKIPVIYNDNIHKSISQLSKNSVEISKYDWDSRESSWDFQQNELIRINGEDLEESLNLYKQFWKNKFFQIHKDEEIINYQFIETYGLKEQLTPEVQLEEISILQDELDRKLLIKANKRLTRDPKTRIVQNYHEIELPFIASEIMIQFISYSVGCMLGRYSLNKEGLILANQGETLKDYLHKIEEDINESKFLPDDDNIIPILDDEWFEDDIVTKFYQFLKVTYGEKNFNKNIAFIEDQICKDIRKYFINDFFPDHIKRFKKRPIYWMFSSPKGSFNALIYMHRYTPDTVSNILNKYLKEFIGKLNTRKEHLERVKETGSASDKSKAIKESDNIQKMLVELHEYERDILFPLATERIEIDLDDGVLVNYNKFGKAVKEVNGLNDPATKKKVKQFDWIDTSQIR